MRYREWKLINESLAGGTMPLGLSNPHSLGGPVGSTIREMDDDLLDDEDEDMEDDEEEVDLFGDEELDPDMDFPPDDSEEMDGLPTPDEEMLDGDEDDFLGDIDPELAGLDDDEAGLGDEMLGDEMLGDEELGDEELGDEMLGDEMLGDEMLGDEMLGDEELGDEMLGDEDLDMLGDEELGDEMGDVEVGDDEEYSDFMDRMADYCGRYMADHMVKRSRKFMRKDEATKPKPKKKKSRKYMCGKGCDDGIHSREDMTDMADNHFGKKQESSSVRRESVGTYEETEDQFFATLRNSAKGDHNAQGWSGLSEDMLLQLNNDPNANVVTNEPQPGEVGFSPQGRVGSIGGGYTQDDFADLETMPY